MIELIKIDPEGQRQYSVNAAGATLELDNLINKLLPDGKPSIQYYNLVLAQRKWLLQNGTTVARAIDIVKTMIQRKK